MILWKYIIIILNIKLKSQILISNLCERIQRVIKLMYLIIILVKKIKRLLIIYFLSLNLSKSIYLEFLIQSNYYKFLSKNQSVKLYSVTTLKNAEFSFEKLVDSFPLLTGIDWALPKSKLLDFNREIWLPSSPITLMFTVSKTSISK